MATFAMTQAVEADAELIASLRNSVSEHLTLQSGTGHWSGGVTEKGILRNMSPTSRVLVARRRGAIVATLRLATKKPWAIDVTYFTACKKPLYLLDMAVAPKLQRQGLGRRCIEQAIAFAREWPGDSIRLDAYDASAGAGAFYAKCGFREVGRVVYRKTPLIYYERML